MPMVELRGLSALEAWSRKVTSGYKDVKVHDLSTSWRDGLAFCALIHHFRPDLIDFDSLSKENILYNNRLAFAIAEKHLGVPSLLDAEDMFKHEEPDRLSVATYLSQFYECFEGSKSDRKPSISGRKSGTNDSTHTNSNINNKRNSLTHPPIPPKRDMRCQKCKLRVFILERIIIDDNIYHKSCYDSLMTDESCIGNDSHLNSDINQVSDNGKLNGCQQLDINDIEPQISDEVLDNHLKPKASNDRALEEVSDLRTHKNEDKTCVEVSEELNSNQSIDEINAKSSELQEKCEKSIEINDNNSITTGINVEINDKLLENESINDNLTVDEVNESLRSVTINDITEEIYPDYKNPFGDEEEEENVNQVKTYPTDMNPFGDEDVEEEENSVQIRVDKSGSLLNPFGEDVDDCDNSYNSSNNNTPKPKPRKSLNVSDVKSPTSSLRGRKKRAAPTPPSQTNINQMNSSCSLSSNHAISGESSRRDSVISSVSSDLPSSVPTSRTPTPLPRLRLPKSVDDLSDCNHNQKTSDEKSENNNNISSNKSDVSLKSYESDSDVKNNTFGYWKTKKRPAPPIPAVKRTIKGSVAEIEAELNGIGDQLPVIEKKSAELEMIIKNRESSDSVEGKEDQVLNEFLSNAREKCRLARRQKELMYMKREHKLEEIQADIEYQMRVVISKQSAQKTEEDQKKEEELLQRLVEIIEERNDIVENMIRDENKEVEEYQKLVSKVMPKTTTNSESEAKVTKSEETIVKVKEHKIKDKKKPEKEKKKKEKSEKVDKNPKFGELKKEAKQSFSFGKSTLKKLGMKSSSDHKLDKTDKKSEKSNSNSFLSNKSEK